MKNMLEDIFKKTTDEIWTEGFEFGRRVAEEEVRMSIMRQLEDLTKADWKYPKGTRREEAVALFMNSAMEIANGK